MPARLHGEILVPSNDVTERINATGRRIARQYQGREPLIVGLLTGAYVFTNRLVDSMVEVEPLLNPSVDFLRVGSYGKGQKSKKPRILGDLSKSTEVEDRVVIVADDITDTGESMKLAVNHLYDLGASDVKIAVMIDREIDGEKPVKPDFIAVRLKSAKWVVGMGLDGPGTGVGGGRSFPYIAECLIQPRDEI
jgi:hypoxanthine phosphoribosyltransferase